jgi:hypothetical protein
MTARTTNIGGRRISTIGNLVNEVDSVECEAVILQKNEEKIMFTTNMYDLGRKNLLGQFYGNYMVKTGKCNCDYNPFMKGQQRTSFRGKEGVCPHYPTGDCDVLSPDVMKAVASVRKKQ